MQAVAGEKLHPAETGELIVAQRRAHPGGRIDGLDTGEILELGGQLGEVRRRLDTQSLQPGQRGGVQRMQLGSGGKLRIDERREMVEDPAHPPDRQAQRVAIGQRRIHITGVRALEGFLEEVAFQQLR